MTAQLNFQLCSHANIQHIWVSYAGDEYPPLPQNKDFSPRSLNSTTA